MICGAVLSPGLVVGNSNMPEAVVVSDAIFCGLCKPQPEPIEMPKLY